MTARLIILENGIYKSASKLETREYFVWGVSRNGKRSNECNNHTRYEEREMLGKAEHTDDTIKFKVTVETTIIDTFQD